MPPAVAGYYAVLAVLLFFNLLGLVQVCQIELSHMGKDNGNPDLVCENPVSLQNMM